MKYYNASEQLKKYRLQEGFDKRNTMEYFRKLLELKEEEYEPTI